MMYRSRIIRVVAATLLLLMLTEIVFPTAALALTDGPSQAEFAGGSGGSMVDPFTGAFSYSIPVLSVPGPNGVGYGLTLNYSNNTSPEAEASWVGLGWSLNAGAINRIKRGYPDDYKNAPVKYWRNMRPNWNINLAWRLGLEALSNDDIGLGGVSRTLTMKYNNYTGYDYFFDLAGNIGGSLEGSIGFSENGVELDGDFRPLALVSKLMALGYIGLPFEGDYWAKLGNGFTMQLLARQPGLKYLTGGNKFYPPARSIPYTGIALSLGGGVEGDFLPNVGIEEGITGMWSQITSQLETTENAWGYLYSNSNLDHEDYDGAGMDYYIERDDNYSDRDRRLPLPFSNADYFSASGAGIGGTFRSYHRAQGYFRPAKSEGSVDIGHLNLDIHVAGGIGVGAAVGGGSTSSVTKGWSDVENMLSYDNDPADGEPAYFRFRGDRGGSILDAHDNAVQLKPDGTGWEEASTVWTRSNNGARAGRSTYIGYNTNDRVLERPTIGCYWEGSNRYRSFSGRSEVIDSHVKRSSAAIADGIGEFSIVRDDGMTYIYGLPVYARDEVTLSYGLYGLAGQNIDQNYLAYTYVPPSEYGTNDNLNGSEAKNPYATTYLLTEVISPDYVDRTNNGPTSDDLGGYVVFNYDRTAGSFDKTDADTSDWYKWRTPYRGTLYSRGAFSDPYDDAGSLSWGLKEIYYLASIETKTHKAFFRTSSRKDGYEAGHNEAEVSSSDSYATAATGGNSKLKKLDRIELWSKDANENPAKHLSTTCFDYGYDLCEGTPNSEAGVGRKKLTLRRVWFEYEGVVSALVSSYQFGYQYQPSTHFANVPFTGTGEAYANVVDYGHEFESEEQNPPYSPYDSDPWGNYQRDGASRYAGYRNWVDQTPDEEAFDPAAWQLKWIKLPSGGEIHVQYEQNDYRYVQHRDAMVMTSLAGRISSDPVHSDWQTYELDLTELGITTTEGKDSLVAALRKQFGDEDGGFTKDREYIYFRFLYGLVDSDDNIEGPLPDPEKCDVEYISGYAAVTDVGRDLTSGNVYIRLGSTAQANTIPDKVCKEFYKGARDGIVNDDCERSSDASPGTGGSVEDAAAEAAYWILQTGVAFLNALLPLETVCQDINYDYSYLRIPTIRDKKGGGIRVKRVLTYDPGLEAEDAALYGVEYIYKTADGHSSGVAANEPASIREENALVHLGIPARAGADSVVSGKGMRQLEEPLGESLLPAASIGYSRVIARNIHTGKSGPGFTVYDFYTARDYPFDMQDGTGIDAAAVDHGTVETPLRTDRSEPYPVELVLVGMQNMYLNATQGYRFALNDMHGQARSVAQYIGGVNPEIPDRPDFLKATMVEQIVYDYYKPWESIPVMNGPSATDITQAYPGKVVEVVTEGREMIDDASDVNLQVDFEAYLGFLFPLPFGSGSGRYQADKTVLRTHATTKIVEYPAILRSVTATQDGITDRTDYVAFDPESGAPLLVKNYDGHHGLTINGSSTPHDGTYYSVGIPAWQHYTQFGQMALTQNLVINSDDPLDSDDGNTGLAFDKRFIRTTNGDEHYLILRTIEPGASRKLASTITTGDLIAVSQAGTNLGLYHVGTIAAGRIQLLPVSYSFANTTQEMGNVAIEVVKSGRSNRVSASVGGFTTYGAEPLGTIYP